MIKGIRTRRKKNKEVEKKRKVEERRGEERREEKRRRGEKRREENRTGQDRKGNVSFHMTRECFLTTNLFAYSLIVSSLLTSLLTYFLLF